MDDGPPLVLSKKIVQFIFLTNVILYPSNHSASQPPVAYSLKYSNQRNDHTPPMKCVSFILTDINECDSSPCENGGTCEDEVNGYTCHCLSGYSGDHCQTGKTPSLIVSCVFLFFSPCQIVSLVFVPEFQVEPSVLTNFTLTIYFIHPSGEIKFIYPFFQPPFHF